MNLCRTSPSLKYVSGAPGFESLHHCVYHTKKTEKIKVVVYCSAQFQGMSLNSELLQSTNLTNVQFGWGVYAKPNFKTWDGSQIEKAHLQFCKRYLEVNNKASNITCRAELGRFPLNKYILYIQSKDEESLVKQEFLMSFDLHCNGKNNFTLI